MEKTKKVLIIDDSAFMRRVISDIISSDNRFEVVGTASNGKEGLEQVKALKPDVISLDVQMPIMDGLTMLKKLQSTMPTPVVMMSTLTKEGAKETIEALELGAVDFLGKPSNIFKVNSEEIKEELLEKLFLAANVGKRAVVEMKPPVTATLQPSQKKSKTPIKQGLSNKLVAIGTSTGGPRALQYVLPYLPANIDAGIVVVQHMPPGFTKSLANRLDQLSSIRVKEAEHGDVIKNGWAYIAPGDRHLNVCEKNDGSLYIELSNEAPVGGHKPAVNVMMRSIANLQQRQYIGVIMTGMGADGMLGLKELSGKRNIHIVAQDEASCVVYGMPKSVVEAGLANEIVSLNKISETITKKLGVL
ncbi:protein-glutamate methylesterase/protein-glutamine glutaminase [Petrocella sp. FN5]|uniref:protein-glutamate methylesterase/protein-glutamine glutaminase n=1 Tax=Petrocella sp. FN5 TaxID=3032002 RepID=UPI0023D9E886|nr:chemotaxis response regulator protein-glutamate methylesterase [Petrocella sp. FN5]MDF1616806.1 chemotaxis response regulator protein-glutamate methylesterase [Petrocella sp. FN5]